MKRTLMLLTVVLLPLIAAPTSASQSQSLFQGLISFRDGPDPTGRTPVFWATSQTLYVVTDGRTAAAKFGADWISQIRWCGDRNGVPRSGECADIFNNFRQGAPVTINEHTTDLLHPN